MLEEYRKEQKIIERDEFQKEKDLIRIIIKTRDEIKNANNNFEYADSDLIDFYIYKIKANQAKLNYLIKLAKSKRLNVDFIKDIEFRNFDEEVG